MGAAPQTVEELEEVLSRPPESLLGPFGELSGDLILLGVGGKMGPTMARMARRASPAGRRIIGVSRFSSPETRDRLESWGIETVACDLLEPADVARLPQVENVIYMPALKFGLSAAPYLAWATNCYLPGLVCEHYRESRIAAFSTGNVYGLIDAASGGSVESDPVRPEGEYAITAWGRERMFEYFANKYQLPVRMLRLNYATELRYGVLVDLALQVWNRQPIDLSMTFVNVIWLADANAMSLRALTVDQLGYQVFNLAGPEILRVKDICQRLGEYLSREVQFVGEEQRDALLSNARQSYPLLGEPAVGSEQLLQWTAEWVREQRPLLGKPTHFQVRDGQF